jgi:hypothetical protein
MISLAYFGNQSSFIDFLIIDGFLEERHEAIFYGTRHHHGPCAVVSGDLRTVVANLPVTRHSAPV